MHRKKRLLWQIYLPFLGVILISLFLVSWSASRSLKSLYYNNQIQDLRIRALLVKQVLEEPLKEQSHQTVNTICDTLGNEINARITVILADGMVIADSEEDPDSMDSHSKRPEIREAYAGNIGSSQRFSYTLDTSMLYVAVPFEDNGNVSAVIRVSKPMTDLSATLRTVYDQLIMAAIFISLFAAVVALMLSHRINKPISEMIAGAKRFGEGDLEHRLYVTQSGELQQLAEAMNHMAAHLDDRIRTVTHQHNEIQTMLSSMVEAIIAVNTEEHIIRFNHAASALFKVPEKEAEKKNISEVVRNTELVEFIQSTLSSKAPQEADIVMLDEKRTIQARGTRLRDSEGENIGGLIVLNDITQLKRMEAVRRDFVANVSHELKTPITSIKGFVETLKDGAMHEPDTADRFLEIVSKHTDRLNAIIEDLLKLSRLEDEGVEIEFEKASIRKIIQDAVMVCQKKADRKKIAVKIDCEEDISAEVNPPLLEEALVNLIDNAIKYSTEGCDIDIVGNKSNNMIQIAVKDCGPGIQQKHLPRIFERFYRIDRARSRDIGGTGLGLSIVKHIVQTHQGEVTVESTVGEGSCFTIHLPQNN